MKFETWDARKAYLNELKDKLHERFGTTGYNVFVFGSFVREDFVPGKSDIDLAIYSEDYFLELDIYDYLEAELTNVGIDRSLIQISTDQEHAFVCISPLELNIGMTDYYPEELKTYLRMLVRDSIWDSEDRRMIGHVER